MTASSNSLTAQQTDAAHTKGKVIVINMIGLREMPLPKRSDFLRFVHEATTKGHKVIFSILEHNDAMNVMLQHNMRSMVPNDQERGRLYHNNQLLFSHAELAQGADGIMGQDYADVYLAIDTYATASNKVRCLTYVDMKAEDILDRTRQAFRFTSVSLGAQPQAPGWFSAFGQVPAAI